MRTRGEAGAERGRYTPGGEGEGGWPMACLQNEPEASREKGLVTRTQRERAKVCS